jgi:FkbM family methyltransferase
MVPVKLNQRWDLILPEHRAARPDWHVLDGWEGPRLLAMSEMIGPGSVVYYVGAEEGDMCGLIASWGAEVAMFEPNSKVWPNIRAIWDANSLPAPIGCWVGFAGHEDHGTSPPPGPDGWPDCAHGPVIGDHGFCQLDERPDIPSIRLDDFAEATGTVPTDISIDVEGSEGRVIDGAKRLLTEHHPRIWLSGHPEFMLQHWGEWTAEHQGRPEYLRDLRNRLCDHGYRETLLSYDHEVHLMYEVAP